MLGFVADGRFLVFHLNQTVLTNKLLIKIFRPSSRTSMYAPTR